MYDWRLDTAVKLASENFLSGIQIAFDTDSNRPYTLEFLTRCGDVAQLVTTHTQQEKRKVSCFSSRGSVIRFLDSRFPGYDRLLCAVVIVVKAN